MSTSTRLDTLSSFDASLQLHKVKPNVPKHILENALLNESIAFSLPKNYEFEIHKTLWRIEQDGAKHIGLQFPEGLLMFAIQISEILQHFSPHPAQVTILGDVTYGACCVDDISVLSLEIDLLVHYGHSCLVPVTQLALKNCLYVFVDIIFDYRPLVGIIQDIFATPPNKPPLQDTGNEPLSPCCTEPCLETVNLSSVLPLHRPLTIALMGTIQYSTVVFSLRKALKENNVNIVIPQELPLTAGEVLGCTSPQIPDTVDAVVFIADGRFHLESVMIHNPTLLFFRYDPFSKTLLRERYSHLALHDNRQQAILNAKDATSVGLILGTLGRQGSVGLFERVCQVLRKRNIRTTLLLMSEINVQRLVSLSTLGGIQAFIQVSCPRLSLDWGHCMGNVPLLTPYEAFVAFSDEPYRDVYPMDYYAKKGDKWTNFYHDNRQGSLSSSTHSEGPFSDLQQRRALIRKRAEARRAMYAEGIR